MTCSHANISLATTSDPDTVCADCGEILQNSSTPALTQTEKQSTLHQPAARCSRTDNSARGRTMKNSNPYRTTFHRDGSVTLWNCLTSNWHRTSNPSDELLSTLSEPERSRVIRHCGIQ